MHGRRDVRTLHSIFPPVGDPHTEPLTAHAELWRDDAPAPKTSRRQTSRPNPRSRRRKPRRLATVCTLKQSKQFSAVQTTSGINSSLNEPPRPKDGRRARMSVDHATTPSHRQESCPLSAAGLRCRRAGCWLGGRRPSRILALARPKRRPRLARGVRLLRCSTAARSSPPRGHCRHARID